jgi:glycosyltransferase involved in cell wall biosynthesis
MIRLVSFRPGVAANGTAFEAMALIYKYLQQHYDYQITVVKSVADPYEDAALPIISVPVQNWSLSSYTWALLRFKGKGLRSAFAGADGILTVDPTLYPQGLFAIHQAKAMGLPVWFDASRTDWANGQGLAWKFKQRWLKSALQQTTGIIVTVPKCIERFRDIRLFDAAIAPKFTMMGHPVNTQQFVPLPKRSSQDGILRVLVVSRLLPEKGLLYILEAMSPLLNARDDVQLQLLGTGPLKPLLQREVAERGFSEKVLFLEPVAHEKLPAILGSVDIYVSHAVSLSQWEEFFGAANLEAMACGLPCVVSTSGGIPYAIREKDVAILVAERDIIHLREAINHLLMSEQARRELGQRARNYVERYYALPLIAAKYHQMLQQGLNPTQQPLQGVSIGS